MARENDWIAVTIKNKKTGDSIAESAGPAEVPVAAEATSSTHTQYRPIVTGVAQNARSGESITPAAAKIIPAANVITPNSRMTGWPRNATIATAAGRLSCSFGPRRRWSRAAGRVEPVVSGQAAHFHTLDTLLAFMAQVLATDGAHAVRG